MDYFWNFWNSLTQGFRENLAAQIIGGVIAALIVAGITFIVVRVFGKKESPSLQADQSSPQQSQQQQVIVNVAAPPIAQPPIVAPEQPRGVGAFHETPQQTPLPNPNIPRPRVGFVPRRDKDGHALVEFVSGLLAQGNACVALWGAGGIGKTALAAEIARTSPLHPSPDRRGAGGEVIWASADGRTDFSLGTLLDETATQLGQTDLRKLALDDKTNAVRDLLGERAGDHPSTSLRAGSGSPLLVMDNFETVAEAEQKRIVEFLANAPAAALITSRQIIPRVRNIEIDAMGDAEAREFVRRSIEQSPRRTVFAGLDPAQIIQTADANPLVMEWVIAQIAEEAHEPRRVFDELAHGKGDAAQRVFDRSFNLLNDDARAALLALTLFAPNASRAALAAVAFGDDAVGAIHESPLQRADTAITRLVSLRLAETTAQNKCVGVAGLTRELAKAHLAQDERRGEWQQRFANYFVNYAEAHAQTTPEDLNALEAERENLLAAMDTAFAAEDWQSVMRVRSALEEFLDLHGYWDDAIVRGEQAAEAARRAEDEDAEARFIGNLGTMWSSRGDYEKSRKAQEQSLVLRKKQGDERNIAVVLHQLGIIAQDQGDYETARARYAESLEIKKKLGDQSGIASTLHQLGMIAQDQGDYETARTRYAESLEIVKKLGDQSGIASTLHQLGMIAQDQGDYETARTRYAESLDINKKLGNQSGIASTLHQLGRLAQIAGDYETARQHYAESLEIKKKLGNQSGIAITLNAIGNIATAEGKFDEASRLLTQSLDLAKQLGDQLQIGYASYGLGFLSEKEGNKTEAACLFRQALEIWERLKSPDAEIARKSLERVEGLQRTKSD